nr:MAG TPA: hypothetical protein [Caudoviricetes sp.]
MKMYLMTFDEACKAYNRKYPTKIDFSNGHIFGIGKKSIPWGENVEVDIEALDASGNVPVYGLNGFFVPTCMFKVNDKKHDKEPSINDILHYGTILIDDGPWEEMDAYIRIKIMSYEQAIYYIKMVNGEVVMVKKVSATE